MKLREVDLTGADLADAVLVYVDLSGAQLHTANLAGADLRGSDLSALDPTVTKCQGALINNEQAIVVVRKLGFRLG